MSESKTTGSQISFIKKLPTTNDNGGKIHESIFRSYHILKKVKRLLEEKVPPHVVLELIEEMEDSDE